jgi:DNA-binding transcriptional MocR family regulator
VSSAGSRKLPLYVRLADDLTRQVDRGILRQGDRVPSLRALSLRKGVSISTAMQAYLHLENRGLLEARPQSGFYVRTPYSDLIPEPQFEASKMQPPATGTDAILAEIMEAANDPANISFGAGHPSPEVFPVSKLNLILRRIIRRHPMHSAHYDFPPGAEVLRRQVARRAIDIGAQFTPREVIVTTGALEAMNLCLRAVTQAGDVVAVESPTYFGILHSALALNLKVLEIPTHPQEGMDLNELERAIRKHRVKACVVMTNCHNPLGYVLSDDYKKSLVELTARHNVAVIEDDVYGDLPLNGPRPRVAKSFDRKELVMLCSSFSKILSSGFRVGWVVAGRFAAEVQRLKFLTSVATASLPQLAVAELMASGSYDRHLKRLRTVVAARVEDTRRAIARYFPEGTCVSRPAGGYLLWVQLPPRVDGLKLYRAALEQHICILPGTIFSGVGHYKNYIRISCGDTRSEARDQALATLGRLCERAR